MKINCLIYGEGPTDYGTPDGYRNWLEGPVLPLVRKLMAEHEITFSPIMKNDLDRVKRGKRAFRSSDLSGHGKIISKIVEYIEFYDLEYDFLIYYGDTDKESGERASEQNARRASRAAYDEAFEAFEYFLHEKDIDVRAIAIIPLRMIEAWLLADKDALEQVIDQAIDHRFWPGKSPELLWGDKHDPTSNYPKHVLRRILELDGRTCDRETFLRIAEEIDLHTLQDRCPFSFTPVVSQLYEKQLLTAAFSI